MRKESALHKTGCMMNGRRKAGEEPRKERSAKKVKTSNSSIIQPEAVSYA